MTIKNYNFTEASRKTNRWQDREAKRVTDRAYKTDDYKRKSNVVSSVRSAEKAVSKVARKIKKDPSISYRPSKKLLKAQRRELAKTKVEARNVKRNVSKRLRQGTTIAKVATVGAIGAYAYKKLKEKKERDKKRKEEQIYQDKD